MRTEDVDNLSDYELRKRLIQYELPNIPITETTRKILIEKLKKKIYQEQMERKQQNRISRISSPFKQTATPTTRLHKYSKDMEPITKYNYLGASASFASEIYPNESAEENLYQQLLRTDKYHNMHDPNDRIGSLRTQPTHTNVYPNYTPPQNELYYQNGYTVSPKSTLETNSMSSIAETNANNIHFGIVNKLLSFRGKTLRKPNTYTYNDNDITIDKHIRSYTADKKITPKRMIQHIINRVLYKPGLKQSLVPHALIILFFLFFITLAAIYMMIRPNVPLPYQIEDINVKICNPQEINDDLLAPCVDNNKLESAINLTKELLSLLQNRAVQYHCVDSSVSAELTREEFIRHVLDNVHTIDKKDLFYNLQAMEYLLKANVQWNVDIMKNDTKLLNSDKTVAQSVATNFVLVTPQLPFKCVLFNKIQRFFTIIGTGAVIGAVILMLYTVIQRIKRSKEERDLLVKQFSEEIVNELLCQASSCKENEADELIIVHLRDKLIPVNKRKNSLWAWHEAVRLLETNDSRIQFGVTLHNGEEFRTLKWIGKVNQNDVKITAKKQWQSPAFDNVNKVVNPPTPCLKIRHMFDTSDIQNPNLKQIIKEAVLEKVGPRCIINDIQIDKNTCCVYIRCPKEEDAGIIHNEINGWWFDKRLVSIKFLRLQRYLSRYPNTSESLN